MNIIKLFKFSFFFVLMNCFLSAMSLELKNSIDVYEDLFSKFSMEDSDMQKSIAELLNHLNATLSSLKAENSSQSLDSDDFSDDDCCDEIDDISSQYESDFWFLKKLEPLLSNTTNEDLFKELYAVASNSQRYHNINVKFINEFRH